MGAPLLAAAPPQHRRRPRHPHRGGLPSPQSVGQETAVISPGNGKDLPAQSSVEQKGILLYLRRFLDDYGRILI